MKGTFLFIISLTQLLAYSQNKGTIWIGGENAAIDFIGDTAMSFFRPENTTFNRTSTSICDKNGNLLFYSNGYRVFNRNYEVLENGDSLNVGDYDFYGFMPTPDGAVIIPIPGDSVKYYLFHMDLNLIFTELGYFFFPTHLFYSVVDLSLDGGNGAIVDGLKDIAILNDTLTQTGIKIIRHGNGRDWWLICHEYGNSNYFKFLIDENGIQGPIKQQIGITYRLQNAGVASIMKFAEEGNRFFFSTFDSNKVELFDFDRCSGMLLNYVTFNVDPEFAYAYGASFSPNARYIYVSVSETEIRQYDLDAANITGSQIIVGTDDGIPDPFAANYFLHGLAPDGKIYIISYDECYSLHVINHPDSAGLASGFVQRGLPLYEGTSWFGGIPNIPNFSLGPLDGSACDTLTAIENLTPSAFTFGVYPNPCYNSAQVSISGAKEQATIFVYNTFGQLLYQTEVRPVNEFVHAQLPLKNLASGVYLVKVKMGNKEFAQKLVKR